MAHRLSDGWKIVPVLVFLLSSGTLLSQGRDTPLTMQGVDQSVPSSVASRSMGGLLFSPSHDPALLFSNPTSLIALTGFQLSVGGLSESNNATQTQEWYPQKYYAGFSLLMEGLTGLIDNPNPGKPGVVFRNGGDTVQRPFDNIPPNWAYAKSKNLPLQAVAALPFSYQGTKFAVGAGFAEYANLNQYYANNNVLSPDIGSERPSPILLPSANDSVKAYWYQYAHLREGSIYGYGGAISAALSDELSFGVSAMLLKGSSTDAETETGRGSLLFVYTPENYFVVDSIAAHSSLNGTSDFSGQEYTMSASYRGRYVTIGANIKPPGTITRKYSGLAVKDTGGVHTETAVNGQDEMKLPWRGTVGISIVVRENVTVGLEYELRPFASALYTASDGTTSNPWMSASLLHVGGEYVAADWLAVRAGVRQEAEAFQEIGAPIASEPITYSVYSVGVGVRYGGIALNVAWEYATMKYQDLWATNVNFNNQTTQRMIADVSYVLE